MVYRDTVNIPRFINQFKLRLNDIYVSQWLEGLNNSSSLVLFSAMKTTFAMSPYLCLVDNVKHRHALSKLRLSSHRLRIEDGRYRNIPRNERKCELCTSNDIEDEYHFVLICDKYVHLREQYIPRFYFNRPSVYKLVQLLNTTKKTLLHRLAIFILKANEHRDAYLNVPG